MKNGTLMWVDTEDLSGWHNPDVRGGEHGSLWVYVEPTLCGDTSPYRLHTLRSLATGYTEQFFADEFKEQRR
jgi:hypothetical protein